MRRRIRVTLCRIAGLLLLAALPATGQLQVGDLSTNLSGVVSAGYNGVYGNQVDSSHGIDVGGSATAAGYYYNPNFFSFNLSPYYGQSRANSDFQSISDSSGFNFSSSIFGGSHFPGSVSYAKAYNSEGQFAVPGLPNFTTHGDSSTFGINWSEIVPNLPSLSANFQMGSNDYNVYGSDANGSSNFHSFGLNSSYNIADFRMSAFYQTGVSDTLVPQILSDQEAETISSNNSSWGFNVGHPLPMRGQFSAGYTQTSLDTDYLGYTYQGTFDTSYASAMFQPSDKLHISMDGGYSNNLAGILFQNIISSGGIAPPNSALDSSRAWSIDGTVSYALMSNMQLLGQAQHREQSFLGETFGANSYGGGITYGRELFGGNLNGNFSLTENTLDGSSQNTLGFTAGANYTRRFGAWYVGTGFTYAQNVETILVTYMNSFYNYSANVRRRWTHFNFSASANVGKTGLTNLPGTNNSAESFTATVGWGRWINLNGSYADSSGNALQTGGGLSPTPLPPIIPTSLLVLYGGKSYGLGLSSSPARRLTISASYAKANSNTLSDGIGSSNSFEEMNTLIQYQFRKMYLTGGYAQLSQGFSASGLPPAKVSSFFVGVTRWFNFF